MRLASFKMGHRTSYGIASDEGVIDVGARFDGHLPDLQAYLRAAARDVAPPLPTRARVDYRLEDVAFAPVIINPHKIICVAANYHEHRQETGRPASEHPALFTRFADTLVGHRGVIRKPAISTALDYEGELAVVIGREAWRVPRERALDVVAGYACFNDATVRDWQRHTSQFTPGKNFPATGAFGPWLVTTDEVGRLEDLTIETRLNGALVQEATLGEMIFSVADIISYASSFTPLAAGDVIATGTPGGVGFARKPPLYMKPGDRVEVRIDRVGHLFNEVADEC
jgi:2-keto-4-pentenoate hydratase/2-oxohepta-3-ene-1,7-dioic acid hydratase in catechol pathway